MTGVQERHLPSQLTTTRSYREIASDPRTNQEDRRAARIRHNLTTYLTSYFSGPQEGDGEVVFEVIVKKTLEDKRVAARVLMLNGEVKDGMLIYEDGRRRLVNSKRTSNKDLIETAENLPLQLPRNVKKAFTTGQLLEPFRFPPYEPQGRPMAPPKNEKKKQK